MNGAAALFALRRRGMRPYIVDVAVGTDPAQSWRDWPESGDGMAYLEVPDDESIDRLDLRCLVGLWVIAWGLDDVRVRAFHAAASKAGAHVVLSTSYRRTSCGELVQRMHLQHVREH